MRLIEQTAAVAGRLSEEAVEGHKWAHLSEQRQSVAVAKLGAQQGAGAASLWLELLQTLCVAQEPVAAGMRSRQGEEPGW